MNLHFNLDVCELHYTDNFIPHKCWIGPLLKGWLVNREIWPGTVVETGVDVELVNPQRRPWKHTICPVCEYEIGFPAADWEICPSCGTQFEYDDAAPTSAETCQRRVKLREEWIAGGRKWWSTNPPPLPLA